MKRENLKKIVNEIGEENNRLKMSEIFISEGERELSDFLKFADEIENKIEPEKSALLNILNNLPQDNNGGSKFQPVLTSSKIKFQIGFNKWIKFTIPVFVAILAVVVFLGNPFLKEQSQITDINKISKEEKTADKADNFIQNYIAGEKQSTQVAQSSFLKAINSSVATSSSSDILPFDSSSVALEANSLSFDPNLAKFVSQENSMSAIDATLASF